MNGKTTKTRELRGRADEEAVGSAPKRRMERDVVEVTVRRRRRVEVAHEIAESASANASGRRSARGSARRSGRGNARESGRGSGRRSAKRESEKNHRAQPLRARARRSVATRRETLRRAQKLPPVAVRLRVRFPPWVVWSNFLASILVDRCSILLSLRSR
jgi:hypothetical protein